MAATYRVIDILSNSPNHVFDYIIRPENNILYKTFKQAFDAANSRIVYHLPGASEDLKFIRSNKKECDSTGGVMRQFQVGPDIECIIMIIRQTIHKPEPVPEEQRRRSARNAKPVNYIDILEESETDEENIIPLRPRAVKVKQEKVENAPSVLDCMPEVISAISIHDDGDPQNMFDDDL